MENIDDWKVIYMLPNGERHNYEVPSINSDGTQEWYQHGQLHRDNDLPAII